MNKITEKERLFCRYYQLTGNYRESAARAGYTQAEKAGLKLLGTKRIADELAAAKAPSPIPDEVIKGFRRLAFGSVADAVSLLFCEEIPKNLDSLDLFCVAEIKRPKAGGIEIKFFDRIKALEHLAQLSDERKQDSALPFYRALEKSAAGLFSEDGGEDYGI